MECRLGSVPPLILQSYGAVRTTRQAIRQGLCAQFFTRSSKLFYVQVAEMRRLNEMLEQKGWGPVLMNAHNFVLTRLSCSRGLM